MMARVLLSLAASAASSESEPARLRVDGSQLIEPESGAPIRLTGFNWQIGRTHEDPGALQKQLAPGANVARLVGVQWGNTRPLQTHPNKECMTNTPPHFFNDKCFADLDPWVRSATDAGLWVILAVRGEYVAGQLYQTEPGSVVFHNETLKNMMFSMWQYVAAHYATFDRIAAYEILSEPRDKDVDIKTVRNFYDGACAAVAAVDPRTPCMVGGAPYYKLWTFEEGTLLPNNPNVIYTFDYFNPDAFVFGTDSSLGALGAAVEDEVGFGVQRDLQLASGPPIPQYGQEYPCSTLYYGWADAVCSTWNITRDEAIPFDYQWHAHNLKFFAETVRTKHNIPLFINQFEVVHGMPAASGRYQYIKDLLSLAQEQDIGWAWWTWAGGNDEGWKHGSSEVVFHFSNGTMLVDTDVIDAMAPYFGSSPMPSA